MVIAPSTKLVDDTKKLRVQTAELTASDRGMLRLSTAFNQHRVGLEVLMPKHVEKILATWKEESSRDAVVN